MKKVRTQPQRADPEFVKEMRELAKVRFFKNFEKKLPSDAEMTRLLRRSPAWKQVIFDLKTKPRKENI